MPVVLRSSEDTRTNCEIDNHKLIFKKVHGTCKEKVLQSWLLTTKSHREV